MVATPISPDLMYRLLVQGVKDCAIYLLSADGIVLNWNVGAERAKGYTADEIVGRNYACFYSEDDQANGVPERNLHIALRDGHLAMEGWRFRQDGSRFWADVAIDAIYNESGTFIGFAKITRDLTEQREAARLIAHQATHDALTGVANRAGVAAKLEALLPQIAYGASVAVHYVDLDRFKPINDTLGHQAGDAVLCEVAQRLVEIAGPNGLVGRMGGDEFAIVQFGSPQQADVDRMAEHIPVLLSQPIPIGDRSVTIGASVGVAVAPLDGADVMSIYKAADVAMYQAKADGRNRVRYHSRTPSIGTSE